MHRDENPAETLLLNPVEVSGLIHPIQTEGAVGGVNQAMIEAHERGLMISIPPYINMKGGDWIRVFWGDPDTPVTTGGVLPEQVGGAVLMFVAQGKVPEGIHDLYCIVTRTGGGNDESSAPLAVLVRTLFPGGTDPSPELPGHQNLAPPEPELPPGGIIDEDAAKNGVKVTIPGYPNMRIYDRITFYWGGVAMIHEVTDADMSAGQVELLVTEEVILEAGDSDQLSLLYRVRDEVHNPSSDYSLSTVISVEVGTGLFPAPLIENPDHEADPYDVIDLDRLGDDDLLVDVIAVDGNGLLVGDLVSLTWTGTTAQGQPVTVTPEPKTVTRLPTVLTFLIPNADVRGLAQGRGQASYSVDRDDMLAGGSKRAFVTFIGVEVGLPKPLVPDAVDGVLDPTLAQAEVIVPGAALEAGDTVYLTWLGTRSNGSVLLHEAQRGVSGGSAGQPMHFSVPGEFIAPLDGGRVTVSYRVNKYSTGLDLESDREALRVGETGAELPAPTTRPPAEDGVIDPDQLTGELVIVVAPYPDMAAGQVVRLVWNASSGPHHSDWMPISPVMEGKEVEFFLSRAKLAEYLGADVRVSYQVESEGEPTRVSDNAAFHVGQLDIVLPLPQILEAQGNELNPDDVPNGATVQIAATARFQEGDEVTVRVIGNGEDGSTVISGKVAPGDAGKAFSVTLPHAVVEANRSGRFELKYEVSRQAGGEPEESGSVHYSVVSDIGDGPLRIMGARYSASIFRACGVPRMLTALHDETLKPVLAEWRYEGDEHWTASSYWNDDKPWLKLYVRSGSETWECSAANVFGSGHVATADGLSAFVVMRDEVVGDGGLEVDMVAWGHPDYGGVLDGNIGQLNNVAQISASAVSFSALLRDGSVVWWGQYADQQIIPGDFDQVRSNGYAFVGRNVSGELFAWGPSSHGVPVPAPVLQHKDYVHLCGASVAFAAIRETGHVVVWGDRNFGGQMRPGQEQYDDIVEVLGNTGAFAALRDNGTSRSVIAWGDHSYGGYVPDEIARLTNVRKLCAATLSAFCIQLDSGEVRAWPVNNPSGDVPESIEKLTNVVEVSATTHAFCARLNDGKVVAWGNPLYGGKLTPEVESRTDIVQVVGNLFSFTALCSDGSVLAWGYDLTGGDTSAVADELFNVRAIYGNSTAFTALTSDGRVVTWGVGPGGGNSDRVQPELHQRVTHSRLLPSAEADALSNTTHRYGARP